jgi:hypothetical protein
VEVIDAFIAYGRACGPVYRQAVVGGWSVGSPLLNFIKCPPYRWPQLKHLGHSLAPRWEKEWLRTGLWNSGSGWPGWEQLQKAVPRLAVQGG